MKKRDIKKEWEKGRKNRGWTNRQSLLHCNADVQGLVEEKRYMIIKRRSRNLKV